MKKQNLFQSLQIGDTVQLFKKGVFYANRQILRINGKRQFQLKDSAGYFWHTDGRAVGYGSEYSCQPAVKIENCIGIKDVKSLCPHNLTCNLD
jgi:hypothetical protein